MIIFDLQCSAGHSFEGWFKDAEDLEQQIQKKAVSCPVCETHKVRQVPSAFAVKRKRSEPDQQMAAHLVGKAFFKYLRDNFEDVGTNFATEALKMHYGVHDPRNIRGVSTPQEEELLRSEGIQFMKVSNTIEERGADENKAESPPNPPNKKN